jgi:hypothetical protein
MTGPPSPDPAIRRRNRRLTNADAEHYANAYGDPDRLRSAFEVYRALAADITLSTKNTATVDVPLLPVGGEHVSGPVMPTLAKNLRAHYGWTDVQVETLENAGITCLRKDPPTSPNSSSATTPTHGPCWQPARPSSSAWSPAHPGASRAKNVPCSGGPPLQPPSICMPATPPCPLLN